MDKDRNWTKWLYWFSLGVAIIAVFKLLDNFTDITHWFGGILSVVMPFIAGLLIAYLFYVPCRKIESMLRGQRIKMGPKFARRLSIFLTYIIALLIIVIIITVVVPAISESLFELAKNLPTYYNNALEAVENQPEDSIWKQINIEQAIVSLQAMDITQVFNLENVWGYVKGAFGFVSNIFSSFVAIVASIYILAERKEILNFFKKLAYTIFKTKTAKFIEEYFAKSNEVFFKFISGQIIDGVVVGFITAIAMSIMGVKYAVLLGFMIGLFNIIPYFGAIISIVVAGIITIFTGGIGQAIWMLVVVIILQQIDANIINPKILGGALKISPLLVIFAVTVGGAYFGFLGMFLAVPVAAVIKIFILEQIEYKSKLKKQEES